MTEEFIVTARKWRPQQFKDVIGQEHITHTLQNSIKTGRVHHANLFCGPRGVGKTTTARIHARALNCLDLTDYEPCNKCNNCITILNGISLDVIEIDGASNNSVDDVRKLRENAKYPPSNGKYKMFIIDEVHMLSNSAFNALLKTLEEPPKHLIFVFATTEAHKVPATIISRCQKFDFKRMDIESIVNQLRYISEKEGITIDEPSLVTIAKKGDGSMRDSQSIFDRAIAFCGKNVVYSELANSLHLIDEEFYFKIGSYITNKKFKEIFELVNEIITKGYDITECIRGLVEYFRNILTIKETNNSSFIDSTEEFINRYKIIADEIPLGDLLRFINYLINLEKEIKFASQPRIKFEMGLIQLASMTSVMEIDTLVNELKEFKKFLSENDLSSVGNVGNSENKEEIQNSSQEKKNFDLDKVVTQNNNSFINNSNSTNNTISNQSNSQDSNSQDSNVKVANVKEVANQELITQEVINQKWRSAINSSEFKTLNISHLSKCKILLLENLLAEKEIKIITEDSFILQVLESKKNQIREFIHSKVFDNLNITFEFAGNLQEELQPKSQTFNSNNNFQNKNNTSIDFQNNNSSNSNSGNSSNNSEQNKKFDANKSNERNNVVNEGNENYNNYDNYNNDNSNERFENNNVHYAELNLPNDNNQQGSNQQGNVDMLQNDYNPNIQKNQDIDVSKLNYVEKFLVDKLKMDMVIND